MVARPANIPEYAPILVIFFENKPQTYGPIKQPETTPQEKDIKLTMIGIFNVAKINEHATKQKHKILVRVTCFLGLISFFITDGIKSTATADAEVKTTASKVDIEAESKSTIIIDSKIMPRVPFPKTCVSIVGIIESIPPSGSCPPKIKREVEPIKYAPQPITKQKIVETIVPLLIAVVSLIA